MFSYEESIEGPFYLNVKSEKLIYVRLNCFNVACLFIQVNLVLFEFFLMLH